MIETIVDSHAIMLTSKELVVFMEEENAAFKYLLDPATLKGVKRKDKKSLKRMDESIIIDGKLSLKRLPKTDHPPMEVDLTASTHRMNGPLILGKASLRYTQTQRFDSMILIHLVFDKGDLGLDKYLNITSNEVHVTIKNTILHNSI
jgi:hypothetical protein